MAWSSFEILAAETAAREKRKCQLLAAVNTRGECKMLISAGWLRGVDEGDTSPRETGEDEALSWR
jgi:hypothetical protein